MRDKIINAVCILCSSFRKDCKKSFSRFRGTYSLFLPVCSKCRQKEGKLYSSRTAQEYGEAIDKEIIKKLKGKIGMIYCFLGKDQ